MGSFMAPYIIELGTLIDLNPYFLIGGICITGPFACLKMVETLNRPLPDTIEEVKVKETTMS